VLHTWNVTIRASFQDQQQESLKCLDSKLSSKNRALNKNVTRVATVDCASNSSSCSSTTVDEGRGKRKCPPEATYAFQVGDTVTVERRSRPGVNKEGGVARVSKVNAGRTLLLLLYLFSKTCALLLFACVRMVTVVMSCELKIFFAFSSIFPMLSFALNVFNFPYLYSLSHPLEFD